MRLSKQIPNTQRAIMKSKPGSSSLSPCRKSVNPHGNLDPLCPLSVSKSLIYHVAVAILLIHTVCVSSASLEKSVTNTRVGLQVEPKSSKGGEVPVSVQKRAAPQAYSFGLGKRDNYEDREGPMELISDDYGGEMDIKRAAADKFAFGLGKRGGEARLGETARFNFGLGKREVPVGEVMYADGLLPEKKAALQRYQFGLGKKAGATRYAFGLGKRQTRRSSTYEDLFKRKYSFGLGKRR